MRFGPSGPGNGNMHRRCCDCGAPSGPFYKCDDCAKPQTVAQRRRPDWYRYYLAIRQRHARRVAQQEV